MRKTSLTVIACAMLLCAGTAQATERVSIPCEQTKLIAQGELELCLAQNSAIVLEGGPDESAVCQDLFTVELARAGSCRYLNNGDGTVSDLNTGLMWEMKTETAGVHDMYNTYTWSTGDNFADGTAFTSFLAMLNNGSAPYNGAITGCFANHCDWRLPSIVELQGIVDLSAPGCSAGTSPCIDPIFGPTLLVFYWSATTDAPFPGYAWNVDLVYGAVSDGLKDTGVQVRAVRSGL